MHLFQQHQGMRLSWPRAQGELTANCAKRDRFREVHASRVLHATQGIHSAIGLRLFPHGKRQGDPDGYAYPDSAHDIVHGAAYGNAQGDSDGYR